MHHHASHTDAAVVLVKTCQTCFHAKIRCDKTQESGLCDRCLRLNKACVFAPSKRRNASRIGRAERTEPVVRARDRDGSSAQTASTRNSVSPLSVLNPQEATFNPFHQNHLSFAHGQELLDIFRRKMTPHFPFVAIAETVTIQDLLRDKPSLCLAILGAASFLNLKLQRTLGGLINGLIGARIVSGTFASLDMLQALLVHLAWAHYQPRPRRYSQHLHLAMSIITDLRMDRPKHDKFWSVIDKPIVDPAWGTDEMRAVTGAYYLASSSSVLLQKPRHFLHTPYIPQCCQYLADLADQPTDKYLIFIVRAQRLIESIDEVAGMGSVSQPRNLVSASVQELEAESTSLKASLTFPLSESPPLLLQIHLLELLLNQSSPGSTPFAMERLSQAAGAVNGNEHLVRWLSDSIFAAKSLINFTAVLSPGDELAISNTEWITLYCGLSLAARFDILAQHPNISAQMQHVRRFLDMSHTLNQIVLRMESAITDEVDTAGDRDAFFQIADRTKKIRAWHQQRKTQDSPRSAHGEPTPEASWPGMLPGIVVDSSAAHHGAQAVPMTFTTDQSHFLSDLIAEYGTQMGMENFSFTESLDFFE